MVNKNDKIIIYNNEEFVILEIYNYESTKYAIDEEYDKNKEEWNKLEDIIQEGKFLEIKDNELYIKSNDGSIVERKSTFKGYIKIANNLLTDYILSEGLEKEDCYENIYSIVISNGNITNITDYSKNYEEFRTLFRENNIVKYKLYLYKKKFQINCIRIQNIILKIKNKKVQKEYYKLSKLNKKLRDSIDGEVNTNL